jgi:hypothetical protein
LPNQIAAPEAEQHYQGFIAILDQAAFAQQQRRGFVPYSPIFFSPLLPPGISPLLALNIEWLWGLDNCAVISQQVHFALPGYLLGSHSFCSDSGKPFASTHLNWNFKPALQRYACSFPSMRALANGALSAEREECLIERHPPVGGYPAI